MCADGDSNNSSLSGQQTGVAGVGLNVLVCLGGLKQNLHSDACLALLQSANY